MVSSDITWSFENRSLTLTKDSILWTKKSSSGNFLDLIERKFYDGLYIHRITPQFCVQFGCPYALNPHVYYGTLDDDAGKGSGPPDTSYKSCNGKEHTRDEYGNIEDEIVKGISNEEGTLSMANSGDPETGGSQVFINVNDNKHLDWWNSSSDSAHPVFGKIIEGYDIVKKIEAVETLSEQPVEPIQLVSVRKI